MSKYPTKTPNSKRYTICNIYRVPGDLLETFNVFIEEFSSFMNCVRNLKHVAYLCGDYNIDLLKVKDKAHYCEYYDEIISHGFFPKITLPTRFSDTANTLIDNIFATNSEINDISGILLNHISDHQMVLTYVENFSYVKRSPKYIQLERHDDQSLNNFIDELKSSNICEQLQDHVDSNPQDNYELFHRLLQNAKDKHLPKKRVRYDKKKHKSSKWITNGILKSINTKDRMYKKLLKAKISNSESYATLKAEFKAYQSSLRRSIKEAKRLYYIKVFNMYKNDIKQTWAIIKDTLQNKAREELPNKYLLNDRTLTNMDEIANEFNKYFINIGRLLSEQINSGHSSDEYLNDKTELVFNFTPVIEDYIANVISNLKNKSSYGYDNISNKLIKLAKGALTQPLTLISNQILRTGIFPKELKISRVKPLFKSGDPLQFNNYRPVSLLPSLSKIFEHVIFDQIMCYLTENSLLSSEQFGFRPGHSTELAALRMVDHIIKQMDNGKLPLCIYIDLSKAFDTLNYDILMSKLEYYGITGKENDLLRSYLTGRSQYVEVNGHKSSHLQISTGIPQGSVLGPLLFLIYINDLPNASNIFDMLMYADDTTLFCNMTDTITVDVINEELSKICDWLGANKLSLNIVKTKYMLYHSINKRVIYPKLKINNKNIDRITQFNFLGVILHERMSWKQHIEHIRLKIAKTIGIIYRLKSIYPSAILLTLYNTLVTPHLHYCLLCWGSIIKENNLLHIMQKRVLRTITNSNYIAHTEPLFKELKLVKITDMYDIAIWKFYHKLMNNQLPMFFSSMTPQLPVACARYELRNPKSHLPTIKHKYAENSIRYCLIRQLNNEVTWASTVEIKNMVFTTPYPRFKTSIKNKIIDSYKEHCVKRTEDCFVCTRLRLF